MVVVDEEEEEEEPPTLDTQYIYQNPRTGKASTHPVSIRHLIFLACPAVETQHALLNANTPVLRVLSDQSYSKQGWKPLSTTKIVKEALEKWYYEESGGSKGPVSARNLPFNLQTRVYSNSVTSWTPMGDLRHLQLAIEALKPSNRCIIEDAPKKKTSIEKELPESAHDELEAFLSGDKSGVDGNTSNNEEDIDEESYVSDNGNRYVKDPSTGNWIHEALSAKKEAVFHNSNNSRASAEHKPQSAPLRSNKSKRKTKFSAKKAKCWIYVTGLPSDATADELKPFFSKAGMLDLNPETQDAKVKIYRNRDGSAKGDASICFAKAASVDLALTLCDEAPLRHSKEGKPLHVLCVERAKFEQQGSEYKDRHVSQAKRKVARLATAQAVDWDEGDINGRITGGRKGLKIIVVKHLFVPPVADSVLEELESELRHEFETACGTVEKMTVFASNPEGVFVVKFATPGAASQAVKLWEGRTWKNSNTKASFWDGVTDFTYKNEAKERAEDEKRQAAFGSWLEEQELPEELRLKNDPE